MLKRIVCALAAVAVLALPAVAQSIHSGGPSDGGARATADLDPKQHMRNVGGSDGAGLCVFTSCEVASRWQSGALDGFQKWMSRRPGGGYPEKLDAMIVQFCREQNRAVPRYVQHTGGEEEFLLLGLKTGRMPCVTYDGRDDFYPDQIAHMVDLAYLDASKAAIIDNNRPGVWVWMTRDQFLDRWRGNGGGWAVVFLEAPPPPYTSQPPAQVSRGAGPRPAAVPGGNFGIDKNGLKKAKRWYKDGQECDRETAFGAVAGDSLADDASRWFLIAVGDAGVQKAAQAALASLPADVQAQFHLKTYSPDAWAVTQFGLPSGVSIRKPAVKRVGAEAGRLTVAPTADNIKKFVQDTLNPPVTPTPTPAPTPAPTAPAINWWWVLAGAGLFLLILKRTK